MHFRKIWITISTIAVIVIIIRLCLPYVLLYYVEKQINKIPGYKAKIADIDINLYRGSYAIKNIQLWKTFQKMPVPFFRCEVIDLSVQWKALLKRKLVAKIIAQHPVLNFVTDPRGKNEQLSISKEWLTIVKTLFPLNFNEITVYNGALHFRSYTAKPPFNIFLQNINFYIKNIQNANRLTIALPSYFYMKAYTTDGAAALIEGRYNPFKEKPTFYMTASLKNMNVKSLEAFLKHYTQVNVQSGKFSFYMEVSAANGNIKGYAKPFMKDLKINAIKNANPIEVIYNTAAAVVAKILENPRKKTIATQINVTGNIENPNTSILSILGYLLRHAFIQALVPQIDHSIPMQEAINVSGDFL